MTAHGFRVWILPVVAAIVLGFIVLSLSIIIAWPALSKAMAKARDKTILTLRLQVADMTNSILAYTTENDGETPDHASLLIPLSPMSPAASWAPEPFIAVGSVTHPKDVNIGATTLDLFMSLARADQVRAESANLLGGAVVTGNTLGVAERGQRVRGHHGPVVLGYSNDD